MKPSRYNHFIPRPDGQVLAFNAYSGGLAIMEEKNYRRYQQLAKQEGVIAPRDAEADELLNDLLRGRFLIDDGADEVERLELANQMTKFSSQTLTLTVAPTLDCNLNCIYCYEEKKRISMDQEVADKVIAFLRQQVRTLRGLRVAWYGGEPLMEPERLFSLSQGIMDICQEEECAYSASIVTNGYLLTREMAERLKEHRVQYAQVTLDGPREVHDARRPLVGGGGTFDVIIDNIGHMADLFPVSIRINIDRKNRSRVLDLLDTLIERGLREKISVYFGRVDASTEVCQNIAEDCLDNRAFSRTEIELYQKALDRGFAVRKIPRPSPAYCGAVTMNSILVDPAGRLYKCWNDVGDPERSLGTVDKRVDVLHPNLYRWLVWSPFRNQRCRSCNILPLCMGGCPSGQLDKGTPSKANCTSWRFNLDQMLELIYLSKTMESPGTGDAQSRHSMGQSGKNTQGA